MRGPMPVNFLVHIHSTGVPGFIQYATDNGDASDITIDFIELEEIQYQFIVSNIELYSSVAAEIRFEGELKNI